MIINLFTFVGPIAGCCLIGMRLGWPVGFGCALLWIGLAMETHIK